MARGDDVVSRLVCAFHTSSTAASRGQVGDFVIGDPRDHFVV
jgi:hypothetical protein